MKFTHTMDTKLLVEKYLKSGGTIKKLDDGEASGALDCGKKDGLGFNPCRPDEEPSHIKQMMNKAGRRNK